MYNGISLHSNSKKTNYTRVNLCGSRYQYACLREARYTMILSL
jgi:hypothetical protein